jgi:CRISPR-associated endonuclease Csn1
MKHTIGLDIGTNSIGWVLLKENEIIDKGVNIFPIGTNLIKGVQEETKNHQRGENRRAKRNLFRYKLRRKQLRKQLNELGLLPDFAKLNNIKDEYQASQLYQLRKDALDKQIPIEEIGRIFLLINKHRGFKSNSKILTEKTDEEGVVKDGINQLKAFMEKHNARTVGEYFHKMYIKAKELFDNGKWHNIDEPYDERAEDKDGNFILQNNRGIRRENGRYVERAMYETEFDLIWDKQKEFYKQLTGSKKEYNEICKLPVEQKREKLKSFKITTYWKIKFTTIFFQRPLKSQKKFIGKCSYEKNKRTAPASSLLFQEFRIWKQLADVRYSDKANEIIKHPLPFEWKQKLVNFLQTHPKLNLREGNKKKDGTKNVDVMDILEFTNKKNFEFNFDNNQDDKTFEGNKTLFAIYSACGEELYSQLEKENNLERLWHILYMAKDDEWLKDTLTFTWGFSEEVANNLVEMGLEEGFANYSSKVLRSILPFMKEGKDEFDAKVFANYEKASDEVKEEIILSSKIIQLKNNELRNPVVEKAVTQTIKLVNAILEKKEYAIDQEKLTIRIESTREFKKPKTEREKIRRGNSETDKKREEYANFLNEKRKEGTLNFAREIYKNDSIIGKFELWLELGGDKNDLHFKEFEKLAERKDRVKHALWLECNRICPYTGKVINLSKLFSSDIEIEHIIPYSRSLDDSFTNKTVTFSEVNKEKADRTAFEYMKGKGEAIFKGFKSRIKDFKNETKEDRFLLEKVPSEFNNNQITNTSYIAKYVRKKLHEVCKDVQFTNGSATGELRKNDWRLGAVLDKIRYEEETGIVIDNYLTELLLYKKDFENWRKKKANSTDIIRTDWKNITPEITAEYEAESKNPIYEWWQKVSNFEVFRSSTGKKDRSDHRHHLLDAIITACCSHSIIQQLSTLNQAREKQGYTMYDNRGNLTRKQIECPLSYEQIKNALKNNLIFHTSDQRLVTSKINRIKKKNESKDDTHVKQKTYSVRGSLVGDNFYGKLKNPNHQGFDKDIVFVKRVALNGENFKGITDKDFNGENCNLKLEESLEKVVDRNIAEILKRRLIKYNGKGDKAFSEEALMNDPVYVYSTSEYSNGIPENPKSKKGNPLPVIKKVRVANKNARNLIQLVAKSDEKDNNGKRIVVNENRYAEADGNYIMALYESRETNKKGKIKIKRDFEILSFYEAVKRRNKGEELFSDEKLQKDGTAISLMKNCPHLKRGDMVVMYENDESDIIWDDANDLKKRLYQVTQLSSSIKNVDNKDYLFGNINFAKHNVSKAGASYKGSAYKNDITTPFLSNYHTQIKAIKVNVNNLGKIVKIGE